MNNRTSNIPPFYRAPFAEHPLMVGEDPAHYDQLLAGSIPGSAIVIVDAPKAVTNAVRSTFGRRTSIQRGQVHKARNVTGRLPKPLHARCASCCDKPGNSTTLKKPSGCCALLAPHMSTKDR